MKKIVSMLLVCVMLMMLAACGGSGNADTTTAATETTAAPVTVASALEILENIWASYAEEEKFAVIGGNMENPVDGAPGNYDMSYAENLTYNLLVPAEQLASVDEAATMIHMMNANTFTCGVVHLTEGTDAAAFTAAVHDAIQNNPWMCGFPDQELIAVIGGEYVLIAFGVNDAMNPFMTHLGQAYADAEILYNESLI